MVALGVTTLLCVALFCVQIETKIPIVVQRSRDPKTEWNPDTGSELNQFLLPTGAPTRTLKQCPTRRPMGIIPLPRHGPSRDPSEQQPTSMTDGAHHCAVQTTQWPRNPGPGPDTRCLLRQRYTGTCTTRRLLEDGDAPAGTDAGSNAGWDTFSAPGTHGVVF